MSIWEKLGFGGYKGFSHESDQLLRSAVELAGNLGCEKADTGHLLLAILQQDHGAAARFLEGKQIREPEVRRQLAESRRAPALHLDRYALAPDLKRTMDYAIIGAQNAHLNRAEPEHLLCAMLEDDGCTAGILLASMGVQLTDAVRECRQLSGQFVLPYQTRTTVSAPRGSRASDKYCRDLTRRAAERELDPVFCREAELDRMVEILCRRQKNNPCLVGEPGVGKTALAEGLAQRIATDRVPRALKGRRRRVPHHRGCRCSGGCHRCCQHLKTGAGPGRDTNYRRYHYRRVPHPHPEGCRTGTPFRQGAGRGAYACAGAGYPQRACAAL